MHLPPSFPVKRYTGFRFVDEGAEGRVWRATDTSTGEPVAVKEYRNGSGRAFYQELRLIAELSSEHLVRLHDFFDLDEGRYIVWEYCAGGNLRLALQRPFTFPLSAILSLARQITSALIALHGACIVHGDVKPENILRRRHTGVGTWKLGDFGIASAESVGRTHRFGTLAYSAPEVMEGKRCPGSDLYSLGIVLGECLPKLATAVSEREVSAQSTFAMVIKQLCAEDPVLRGSARGLASILETIETRLQIAKYESGADILSSDSFGEDEDWLGEMKHA